MLLNFHGKISARKQPEWKNAAAVGPAALRWGRLNRLLPGRRFFYCLTAIVFLGIALRITAGLEMAQLSAVTDPPHTTDMSTYKERALDILNGNWPDHFYYQPFYANVFLPLVFGIFGAGVWGVLGVHSLISGATIWLAGITGARMFGKTAGLAAALLLCFYDLHIFYTPFLLIAVLQTFWLVLLVFLGQRYGRRPTWWACAVLGLIAGLATLTRGNIMLLLPCFIGVVLYFDRHQLRKAIAKAAILLALYYLPQVPFAVQNYQYHGRWTGPSSAQDAVLALGNNPEAPPGGLLYTEAYNHWMSLADKKSGERTPVWRQMAQWLQREPLALPELKFRAFLLFWNRREVQKQVAMEIQGRASRVMQAPLIPFSVIGILGLSGLVLGIIRKRRTISFWFLVSCLFLYMAGCILFYVLARFRLPIVPLLCLTGGLTVRETLYITGAAVTGAKQQFRQRGERLLLLLLCAFFFVVSGYSVYRSYAEQIVMRWVRPHGVRVPMGKKTRIHDHGPREYGGWYPHAITSEGVSFVKIFDIQELDTENPDQLTLEFPFYSSDSTKVNALVRGQKGSNLKAEESWKLKPAPKIQKKRLVIQDVPPLPDRKLPLHISITAESSQPKFFFDRQRWYARTKLEKDNKKGNAQLEHNAEAVLTLSIYHGSEKLSRERSSTK